MSEPWHKSGEDPDYRFSLANERTFLAWIRTALAILAGAILLHQIQLSIAPWRWGGQFASPAVSALSSVIAIGAYTRWKANEIAMRHRRALPLSPLIPFLASVVALIAISVIVVALWQ